MIIGCAVAISHLFAKTRSSQLDRHHGQKSYSRFQPVRAAMNVETILRAYN
jgi:hypothetical protein